MERKGRASHSGPEGRGYRQGLGKGKYTVSLEHGTIKGAAGDSQIVKGTDARPSSQDFVLWTVEHDEGNKGPREAK